MIPLTLQNKKHYDIFYRIYKKLSQLYYGVNMNNDEYKLTIVIANSQPVEMVGSVLI